MFANCERVRDEEREQSKEAKEAREKQQAEDTRRMREREASQSDNKIAAATATMGNWGTQLSDTVSDRNKAQSNKVFNVTGLTGALKGEKEGNLGINLDNSKYVTTTSERNAEKIDNYFENRKAEKLRNAELEAQKKQIAETPENGNNGGGGVLALPSEQLDESHVTAQQSEALEEQDLQVVAEQRQASEQVQENNVEVRQLGASEEQDNPQVVADQAQTSEQVDENNVEIQKSDTSEVHNFSEEKLINHEEVLRQKNGYVDDDVAKQVTNKWIQTN